MQVDITLFVQACNFFVAWFLLHKLYFKPAITALDDQAKEQDAVLVQKRQWHAYVAAKQHEISTCWHALKKFARLHIPAGLVPERVMLSKEAATTPESSMQAEPAAIRTALIEEFKEKIVAEVYNVDL